MRLSEAIRKGAKLRPQLRGIGLTNGVATCALGAAHESIWGFVTDDGESYRRLRNLFPFLDERMDTAFGPSDVLGQIYYRNDIKGWTREEIADWVEQNYESKLPQKERESDDSYTKRVIQEIVSGAERVTA